MAYERPRRFAKIKLLNNLQNDPTDYKYISPQLLKSFQIDILAMKVTRRISRLKAVRMATDDEGRY